MPVKSRDYRPFLEDIRQSCERVLRYTIGLSEEQFLGNDLVYDATIRHLTIIGEAVKQIPDDIRAKYPAIEWRQIARFRDYVIYHCFAVNNEIIWDIVENKVPQLLAALSDDGN